MSGELSLEIVNLNQSMAITKELVFIRSLDGFTCPKLFWRFRTASSLLPRCFQPQVFLLQADALHPSQSQNKLRATWRRSGGRHPPTPTLAQTTRAVLHVTRGTAVQERPEPGALHSISETAAGVRHERTQRTTSQLHKRFLTPALHMPREKRTTHGPPGKGSGGGSHRISASSFSKAYELVPSKLCVLSPILR